MPAHRRPIIPGDPHLDQRKADEPNITELTRMYGNNELKFQFANGLSDRRRQPSFLPRNSGGCWIEIDQQSSAWPAVLFFQQSRPATGNGTVTGDGVSQRPDRQVNGRTAF